MSINIEQQKNLSHEIRTLSDVFGRRGMLDWRHIVVCLWFAAFFIYLNHIPLFHTDLWGHVAYGDWILRNRSLPVEDPFLSLAEGVRVVDSAWLGQIILASVERSLGPEWLSNLYALVGLNTSLVLAWVFYLRTKRIELSLVGAVLVLLLSATRIAVIRTEIFGGLCFALIILLLTLAGRPAAHGGAGD
jgi:hypothetical protein